MSKIIYLATPYTHEDPSVMDFRSEVSDIIAADLTVQGETIFAPIMWHHVAKKHNLPKDWGFWADFDEDFIKVSGKLLIILIAGVNKSVGVSTEIKLANKYNLEIDTIDPKPYVKELIRQKKKYTDHLDYQLYNRYGKTEFLEKEINL